VTDLRPGQRFAGYVIERQLGRGGMGAVHLARDERIGRRVALKVIVPSLADDPGFQARFAREARIAARLEHPNVVPVYDVGEHEGALYIAMRYIESADLAAVLREQGPLAPGRAARIVAQICAALDAAHRAGLVHRDVKPANVLLTGEEPEEHAYLTDFGLAREVASDSMLTGTGEWVGTLDYVAPEQIQGDSLDARTDVYAVACLAFHALTGRVPHPGPTATKLHGHLLAEPPRATELAPDLPPAVDAVLVRGMAKRPEDRPSRTIELAHDLAAAVEGRDPQATRPAASPPDEGERTVAATEPGEPPGPETAPPTPAPAPPARAPAPRPAAPAPAPAPAPAAQAPAHAAPTPAAASPVLTPSPAGARPRRRGRLLALAAALLILGGAGAALALSGGGDTGGGGGGTGARASAALGGCPVFPADNPWNQRVDGMPVAPDSDAIVRSIGLEEPLFPDFGTEAGVPFTIVPEDQPRVPVAFTVPRESDPGPYPIPPGAPIERGEDDHVLVVQRGTCRLYEMFQAQRQDDGRSWRATSGAVFDLRSNRVRPEGFTSADGAGLPILPGLARFDEVQQGEIRHALRFTAPQTRREFIFPARHFASDSDDPTLPAMGQRLRLRANVDLSGLGPQARVVARALQRYGMLLADNGSPWFVTGAPDPRWDNDDLRTLRRLSGSDFEVVMPPR